jgi:hypothetical protein
LRRKKDRCGRRIAYVDVESAKVRAELFLLLNANVLEILASKDDDASLGDQKRKFVFLDISQLGELNTFDLCPDARSQFRDLEPGVLRIEKVRFGFIGFDSAVDEFKGLGRWEFGSFIVDGKVVLVFVL